MNARRLAAIWLAVACIGNAAAQPVQGDVAAIGFQAPSGFIVRLGRWIPIQVRLSVQGSQLFEGELRAEGVDLDGDRVAYIQTPVTVTPEAGAQRAWCYLVVNSLAASEWPASVDILSADGALVGKLPLPTCEALKNDDLLVLDISRPAVVRRGVLMTPGRYRNIVVAQMPSGASDLPDRWWGLEAVDVVVWDQPDPASISVAQLDALVQWVRNGGQLVVGVGANWGALRKSALGDILPYQGDGPTVELPRLPVFCGQFGLADWRATRGALRQPIAATTAPPAADAVVTLREGGAGVPELNLIALRPVGSGRVVATAARLRDLCEQTIREDAFYAALLDLNTYSAEFQKKQESIGWSMALMDSRALYEDLVSPINFSTQTALRGVAAFIFVAAYVLAATLASWWWLRRRQATHLSWTVFAGFAVAASALSLLTVSALRGLSRVHTLNVLDLEAGSSAARGPCLFGYRSALRQHADLSLPGAGSFLRPLPRRLGADNAYVTPERYAGIPARAQLDNVYMRATLKQFEGYWHGELDGTIRADLVVSRGPQRTAAGRLTAGSWIANDLAVDLEGGYLLFIDPRQQDRTSGTGGVPARAAGLTKLYDDPADLPEVPPACNVLAVRLPRIAAGQQVGTLGRGHYADVDKQYADWLEGKLERKQMPDLDTLWLTQQAWAARKLMYGRLADQRVGLSNTVMAALLASTRGLYLHNNDLDDFASVGTPITTEALQNLDITHWLLAGKDTGTAVLLCWSEEAGPARLHRDGKPLKTSEGVTLYRVRVPIRYEGRPPAGGANP